MAMSRVGSPAGLVKTFVGLCAAAALSACSTSDASSVVEGFGFFEMPYLVRDRAHLKRIEEEIFWPKIEPLAEARGYKVLALWEHGFRQITNNVRPIVTPDDMRGIKLRTPK